ncbi:MAG: electron transfer flavoprotein subunit beta/FixA family protein [Candidatus Aenigmatarchaeota archaeon]
MDIIVLIKATPILEEAKILENNKNIDTSELKFFINEPDTYALEEAILKKEKYGGKVTVVTLSDSSIENDVNDMIWESYSKGADDGIVITHDSLYLDPYSKAIVFSEFLKNMKFDLILLGAESTDTSYTLLGPLISKKLGLPYLTLVSSIEVNGNILNVIREMEEGIQEKFEIPMPAVLTIQSGINTPRYPRPFVKIRAMKTKLIKKINLEDIIKNVESEIRIKRNKIYIPPSKGAPNILKGEPEEIASKLTDILKNFTKR